MGVGPSVVLLEPVLVEIAVVQLVVAVIVATEIAVTVVVVAGVVGVVEVDRLSRLDSSDCEIVKSQCTVRAAIGARLIQSALHNIMRGVECQREMTSTWKNLIFFLSFLYTSSCILSTKARPLI